MNRRAVEEPLLVERRGPALVLTFHRPDVLNVIDSAMLDALDAGLDEAERDDSTRVVIVTGSGPKAFVAGADISEYASQDRKAFAAYQRRSRDVFTRLDRFPKPVIGAVNGYALGGGFEIALCCDMLLASRKARFGLPEGLLGLTPGGGGTQRLARAVGPFVAADVLLSARRLTAEEAAAFGLVSEVTEPETVLEAAVAKAEAIVKVAPLASREMLELIALAGTLGVDEGLDAEHQSLLRLRETADAAEGIRAFVEKREPRFRGA